MQGIVEDREMKKYIYSFQAGKAVGLDEFHVEFLQSAPPAFTAMLRHLMNLVLTKRVELDERWLLGVIRLLYKKEPASSLANWRPICLLQMVYKLTAAILHDSFS